MLQRIKCLLIDGLEENLLAGLYIVFQIVKGHRGSVDVESGRNNQTALRIVLPRSPK
jgi:sensor histidine kinase regulating citrate/malate metabolism